MFNLRSLQIILSLLIFGFLASGALPQSEQDPLSPTEQPIAPRSSSTTTTDNATLNLHRWGAVTLFHGLPSDRVNAIAEDANGVMWFATDNGLVRYDGRNVEAAPNESALPSRRILALKFDARSVLWIGTEAGAARLQNDRIEVLAETRGHAVASIASSPSGEIALVTAQGEIVRYPAANAYQPRGEPASGILSRGTSKQAETPPRAIRLDPATHPYQLKMPNQANEALPLTAIAYTPSNEWAIGSSGRGLLIHNENEVREAVAKPPRPYFISALHNDGEHVWIAEQASRQAGGLWVWQNGALRRMPLNAGPITAIHTADIEIWAAASRQGVYLMNRDYDDLKLVEHLTFENTAGGLRSNNVNAIFRDREGVVWFGTDRGVCRYDRTSFRNSQMNDRGQSNFVRTLLRTKSGGVWSGTNSGLFQLAGRTHETNYDSWIETGELQGRSIYALIEDAAGAVWAGTSGGLLIKAKDAANFRRIASPPKTVVTIENENALEPHPAVESKTNPQSPIPEPRESVRALATFRGQVYAAFLERGLERIEGDRRVTVLGDAFAKQAISLAAEGDEALWIGTTTGELWRYDGAQAQSQPLPQKQPGEKAVHSIAVEQAPESRRLWIGTSRGLYLREGGAIREVRSGLNVQAIFPEGGNLWIATQNNGLIKHRRADDLWIQFDTEQGLASRQVFALAASVENDILIGSNRGVTRHRPNPIAPRVAVRRLVADRIYLPEDLVAERPLDHPQRYFLLEVTGLGSRTYPSQFQYEFTLTNTRDGTVRKSTKSDPNFAAGDLSPAAYAVTVRAISRDLVYSEPIGVRLRVRGAPFPRTTLLLATLLAAAVAAAAWAFRQQRRLARTNVELERTNVELHETRLRLANETEAERSRIARDLHDQTLADLRHLLVLTDQLPASSYVTGTGTSGDEAAPSPAMLRREIESISSEIRHICEDLSPSVLENIGFLPALEWALADAVAHLPADGKFAYEFNCEPELEDRLKLQPIEQIQLYRIVQEALNNICRHARAGLVTMSVWIENAEDLLIEITDNGVGFDGARSNKTGHGIANIQSRANLIGAQVEWQGANPGCRFVVRKSGPASRDFT